MTDRPDDTTLDGPGAVDTAEVRSGGLGARAVAIGLGAVLLVGGVAFAATQLGGSDGSDSPEEAVAAMFDALGDEDVLGVLATLDEGERDTLTGPVEDLFDELERLGVVDGSLELDDVPGIDLEFDDLTFRSEPIADDLARVHITGGTASYSIDGAELPVGEFLADTLEQFGIDPTTFSGEDSDPVTGAGDDLFLVAHDSGDGWRVSIGYTAVEAIRGADGAPVPANGLAPIGADSPEAAVEGLLQAATQIDVPGIVARLSPAELGALHRYWPVLVDESGLPSADDVGFTVTLTDLELDSDTDGDRAEVFVRSIGFDAAGDDWAAGATMADGCVTLRDDALEVARDELGVDGETVCQDDFEEIFEDVGGQGGFFGGFGGLAVPGADEEVPEMGLTTTRVDGKWYVAPVRTWADLGLESLRMLEREDIEAAIASFEGFLQGDLFGEDGLGGGFVPPGFDDLDGTDERGLPAPSTSIPVVTDTVPESGDADGDPERLQVVGLVRAAVGEDPDVVNCVLSALDETASPEDWAALAESQRDFTTPPAATQDVFFAALDACGA